VARGRSPVPDKPVSGGRHDENQRLAGVQRSSKPPKRDAGAIRRSGMRARRRSGVRDLRWATVGLDFSEERSGGRLKRRPVSTWVDDRGATLTATYQVVAGTGVPLPKASPGRRHLSRSSSATAVRLGCRSGRSLHWGSCGGTLIRYALSTPGGVPPVKAIS
jgi:hypothetical protein